MNLGAYELQGEVGRGAMGIVYRARHRATGVLRAVKLLGGATDPEAFVRFRREAEALARAGGDGVVPVHELGREAGRVFVVMSLMTGGSLSSRVSASGGRLEPEEAIRIAVALARALERCHAVGIVHRDVKPANVLFDDEGRPRLADFGIVRDLGASKLTETGTVLGTPRYMAPEQLAGEPVDGRADVYALGVMLYELVAGKPPHAGRSPYELLRAKSAGKRERLPATMPAGLEAVIERALVPDREARSASAAEMRQDLEAILAGVRPLKKVPAPRRGRAALLVTVVAAGGAVLAAHALRRDEPPSKTPPERANVPPVASSSDTAPVASSETLDPVVALAPVFAALRSGDFHMADVKLGTALRAAGKRELARQAAESLVATALELAEAEHDDGRCADDATVTSRIAGQLHVRLRESETLADVLSRRAQALNGKDKLDARMLALELVPAGGKEIFAAELAGVAADLVRAGAIDSGKARDVADLAWSFRRDGSREEGRRNLDRNRFEVFTMLNAFVEAIDALVTWLEEFPGDDVRREGQAHAWLTLEPVKRNVSVDDYDRAVDRLCALKFSVGMVLRGIRRCKSKDPKGGLEDLTFVIDHAKDGPIVDSARYQKALVLADRGEYAPALDHVEAISPGGLTKDEVVRLHARLLIRLDRLEQAAEVMEKAGNAEAARHIREPGADEARLLDELK